jgi:hypothetical protein
MRVNTQAEGRKQKIKNKKKYRTEERKIKKVLLNKSGR